MADTAAPVDPVASLEAREAAVRLLSSHFSFSSFSTRPRTDERTTGPST